MRDLPVRAFYNALRILNGIDLHELEAARFPNAREIYPIFSENPWRFFIKAGDRQQEILWEIIQKRQPEELRAPAERVPA